MFARVEETIPRFSSWEFRIALTAHDVHAIHVNMVMKPTKRERIPQGKALVQVVIDKNLRRHFKARCVEVSMTMSQKAEELIRDWLEKKS
jgi:hypothetical protein